MQHALLRFLDRNGFFVSFLLKPQGLRDVTNVDVRLRGRRF